MSTRQKLFILLAVLVLLLALVIRLVTRPHAVSVIPSPKVNIPVVEAPSPVTPAPEKPIEVRNATRFAMQFAERYGSFSNEANYQNLKDLRSVTTLRMQGALAEQMNTPIDHTAFYGITSRSVSAKVALTNETTAVALISVSRTETKGKTKRTFPQNLRLMLLKDHSLWKVDSAEWLTP